MYYLIECPKLISKQLDKHMPDILESFSLYHRVSQEEVMDIFKSFPYLFCCDPEKIRKYMSEFRKYRFPKGLVINVVSQLASKVLECK